MATRRRSRPSGAKNKSYITAEGAAALQREMHKLWTVERPKITEEVHEAALLGDRSENAGYIYGKKRLREIDQRVKWLSDRLDNCTIVRDPPRDQSKVSFGAWVRLEDDEGEERVYRLVGPDEFDVKRGFISVESPIGKGLLGKRVDDEITIVRPKGDLELTILEISYQAIKD